MLELKARDAAGRICLFHTAHGSVETPTLLPVINPNQMLITPKEMVEKFGTQMVITNSYIIRKTDALRERALRDGVHALIGFDGPIMTDSGTFQSYVYGDVDVDPLDIVRFQRDIGVDIGTILDIFITPDMSFQNVRDGIDETVARAHASIAEKGAMTLACTVQGGVFPALRESCAQRMNDLDTVFNPIGGVVPLMEQQRYADLVEAIIAAKKGLSPSHAVHLFGCGHPMIFALAVALGCDFFDSASYAKYAKAGRMLFVDGTRHLADMSELACSCPVCSSHTADELRALPKETRIRRISEHNLYVSFEELRRIKEAIRGGFLWELVERRCRSHPTLLDALKAAYAHAEFLERSTPISKTSAFFYTGPESAKRVEVLRYRQRFFERYRAPRKDVLVMFDDVPHKPYTLHYGDAVKKVRSRCDADFFVQSFFGPVPLALDEVYPIAQSVIPRTLDSDALRHKNEAMEQFAHTMPYGIGVVYEGAETLENLDLIAGGVGRADEGDECAATGAREDASGDVLRKIKATADYQFGAGAGDALCDGGMLVTRSKKTGKLRTVFCDDEHILSMRADDGFFTLKAAGARKLHRLFPAPQLRVRVNRDSAEYNRQGKSVFAKFVLDCDDAIRPKDEILIVTEDDELIGVGRALMNRDEMLAFTVGTAVKLMETLK